MGFLCWLRSPVIFYLRILETVRHAVVTYFVAFALCLADYLEEASSE